MTWDDSRDFVDDFVDGLTDGLSSGIVAPTTVTKSAPTTAVTSFVSGGLASALKPSPTATATPTSPSSSVVLHTPLATIPTAVQRTGASSPLAAAAKSMGDITLSTPGVAPHIETPPVAGDLDSRLRAIQSALYAIRVQSEATSQHRSMMNRDDFRKNVIARLSRIESRLPAASPAREQIRTIRVLL